MQSENSWWFNEQHGCLTESWWHVRVYVVNPTYQAIENLKMQPLFLLSHLSWTIRSLYSRLSFWLVKGGSTQWSWIEPCQQKTGTIGSSDWSPWSLSSCGGFLSTSTHCGTEQCFQSLSALPIWTHLSIWNFQNTVSKSIQFVWFRNGLHENTIWLHNNGVTFHKPTPHFQLYKMYKCINV